MMRDLIERFSYRFHLWLREQRGDFRGADGTRPIAQIYRKDESIPQMVIRHVGVLFGGVIVLTGIGRIIDTFAPKAAFAVFVVLVVLIPFWIFAGVAAAIGEWSAKKQQTADTLNHLTNRSS
jgi:uncharacterized membrane protein YcjF (UPF0283 family)